MTANSEFLITALAFAGVFLGVLAAFEGFRQILTRTESTAETRNRRMRLIAKGATTEERLRLMKPDMNGGRIARAPLLGALPKTLRQAGLTMKAPVFLGACAAGAFVVTAGLSVLLPPIAALGLGLILGFGLPLIILNARRRERVDLLVRQLPDALDLMSRGLRVGHPLNATIASVANDMPDPVAAEFSIMVDQIAYGDELVDAFMDFADRIDVEDVRYLAISAAIQHGTGGDLAQVLQTLAQVIRDRLSMRKRIKAISAEGRLTSGFLSLLPAFILVSTSISAPGYYTGVMDDPMFRPLAIIVAVLIVVNFIVMRRLVTFRF